MTDDIWFRVEGPVGRVTLNRPKTLNALNYEMAMDLERALLAWASDPNVRLVLINSSAEKAFSAGGDIQKIYKESTAGNHAYARRFWADEYRLNALIANYPKPYVAFMHGIVMGGGVGVSAHGSHRVVTERSLLSMPECAIGLTPDVGGSLLLARAPGRLGEYLALTGACVRAGDIIHAGLADFFVLSQDLPRLAERLVETGDAESIREFAQTPPAAEIAGKRAAIDRIFAGKDAVAILAGLEGEASEWAIQAAADIRKGSPLSIAASLVILRAARADPTIECALAREYRFTYRSVEEGELLEGIRAAVIDKDRAPRWSPARIEDLPPERLEAMLASLGEEELSLKGTEVS